MLSNKTLKTKKEGSIEFMAMKSHKSVPNTEKVTAINIKKQSSNQKQTLIDN